MATPNMSHSPCSSSSFLTLARTPTPTVFTGSGQSPSQTSSVCLRSSKGDSIPTAVSTPTKNRGAADAIADTQPTNLQTEFPGMTARSLYSPATPTSTPGSTLASSSPSPLLTSGPSLSPLLTNKRAAFLNKHMRSKSSHYPGMITPPSSPSQFPLATLTPNTQTRVLAPPLFRSTSLPSVPQYERSADRKFVPTLGTPSPSSAVWRNGSSITPPQDRIQNFKMRERSPSRRPALSSSALLSSPPKSPAQYSSTPLVHQPPQALWANMEVYPSSFPMSSPSLTSCSSCPSTPNSLRSRSPSISSLETIPDSPDAEAEALEAERLAEEARKLAQEQQQAIGMSRSASTPGSDRGLRRKSHMGLDSLGGLSGLRLSGVSVGTVGLSSAEEKRRKRWSVCGGEKRADLELETIWEDRVVAVQSPPQQCVGVLSSSSELLTEEEGDEHEEEYEYCEQTNHERGRGLAGGEMI